MFSSADSFNRPINKWNVSNVWNMYHMFSGASSFNQPINKWNVSSGFMKNSNIFIDMDGMFEGADLR